MTKNGKLTKAEYKALAKIVKNLNVAQEWGIRRYEETKSRIRYTICSAHVKPNILVKLSNGAWGVNTTYLKPIELKNEIDNRKAWCDEFCQNFKGKITETDITLFSEDSKFII